jgi:hypothetical protein
MSELPLVPGGEDVDVLGELIPARVDAARNQAPPERLAELEAKIARAVHRSRPRPRCGPTARTGTTSRPGAPRSGLSALPASPATVAAYVADLADPPDDGRPRAVPTIERRLAAISEGHKVAGEPSR